MMKGHVQVEKILASMIMLLWLALPAFPGELTFVQASPKDKCAVCGMFVAKYANWTGEIISRTGPMRSSTVRGTCSRI